MILSLISIDDFHVFSFFQVPHSIQIPSELWFESVCASLRMKKNVIILESEIEIPVINPSSRWEAGPQWVYLAPRSLGPIVQSKGSKFSDFAGFKVFLSTSK